MALVTPLELVGIARLQVVNNVWSYVYSNGFETGTPAGATAGSASILDNGAGDLTLFLNEPVNHPFAAVQVCSTTNTPLIGMATAEFQPTLAGAYAGCDAKAAVRIRTYLHDGVATDGAYTIMVWRDPVTTI